MKLEWSLGAWLAFLLALVLAVAGATWFFSQDAGKAGVLTELSRLTVLTNNGELAPEDLSTLKGMLSGDATALHELEEVRVLAFYGEQAHASHALSLLANYVRIGHEPVCTGHYLAHYYMFSKYGEAELAGHELEHARESYGLWFYGAVRELPYQEKDAYDSALRGFFARIDAGDSTATEEEVDYLAEQVPCFSYYYSE